MFLQTQGYALLVLHSLIAQKLPEKSKAPLDGGGEEDLY